MTAEHHIGMLIGLMLGNFGCGWIGNGAWQAGLLQGVIVVPVYLMLVGLLRLFGVNY
jgi:hypothetical protein